MQTADSQTKDLWRNTDTLCLIKLISELKSSFDSDSFNNNELYIQVANKLFEHGFSRTYLQCKKKWKELVTAYTEHKKSPEDDPPPYYSEIDNVLLEETDISNDIVGISNESTNQFGPTWTAYETTFLIKVMKIGNFVSKLKTNDPMTVYEQIAEYLQKAGSISRTKEDIQLRWKNLKQSYIKYIKGDILHFKYFESMDALLDWEPNSIAFEEDQFKDGHEYGDENYQNMDDYEVKPSSTTKRALNWTHKETEYLLDVIQKYDIKNMKRENISAVFDEASVQLRIKGYKRSAEQCRVKFKHLKVKYFSALRKLTSGQENPDQLFHHYDRMKEIMQLSTSYEYSETDNDTSDNMTHDDGEHYEVEYLEESLEDADSETFEKVFVKEQSQHRPTSTVPLYANQQSKKARVVWSQKETQYLLNLLKVRNVKRYCRKPMFEEIAHEMTKAGYTRSAQMCMIKWKNLRNSLYACIRNMVEGKDDLCPFYDEICEIVQKNGQVDITLIADQDHNDFDESEDGQFDEDSPDPKMTITLEPNRIYEEITREPKKRPLSSPDNSKINISETSSTKKLKTEATTEPTTVLHDEPDDEVVFTEEDISSSKYVCNYKMDDTEHYCISLASTFKRLPKKRQAKLKVEIQKLLFKAEFAEDF